MATIKVLDTELELDLLDADELEKVDAAIQAVEGDAQQDPALSQADNMRKQVGRCARRLIRFSAKAQACA